MTLKGIFGFNADLQGYSSENFLRAVELLGSKYTLVRNEWKIVPQVEHLGSICVYRALPDDTGFGNPLDTGITPEQFVDIRVEQTAGTNALIHLTNELDYDQRLEDFTLRAMVRCEYHERKAVILNYASDRTLAMWLQSEKMIRHAVANDHYIGFHAYHPNENTDRAFTWLEAKQRFGGQWMNTEFAWVLREGAMHDGFRSRLSDELYLDMCDYWAEFYAQHDVPLLLFSYDHWTNDNYGRQYGFGVVDRPNFMQGLGELNKKYELKEDTVYYDLGEFVCPANGLAGVLGGLGSEHVVCRTHTDGWVEQRKNRLMEEFQVTSTEIRRGADTSDLWRLIEGKDSYTGTFYVQYDLSGRYGAKWLPRYMRVGDVTENKVRVVVYSHDGKVLHSADTTDYIKFVQYYPEYELQSGIVVKDVVRLVWRKDKNFGATPIEGYLYAKGRGLVGWNAPALGQSTYLTALTGSVADPVRPAAPARPSVGARPAGRPPTQNLAPTLGEGQERLISTFSRIRDGKSLSASVLIVTRAGREITVYPATRTVENGYTWHWVEYEGKAGWQALVSEFDLQYVPAQAEDVTLTFPFTWQYIISSHFGVPRDYGKHEGTDFAPIGDITKRPPVIACADGIVESVRTFPQAKAAGAMFTGYGMYVRIKHGRYTVWYAHLESTSVKVGQTVKRGDEIGLLGTSGNSTGYHLHLTVQHPTGASGYVIDKVVNPLSVLKQGV